MELDKTDSSVSRRHASTNIASCNTDSSNISVSSGDASNCNVEPDPLDEIPTLKSIVRGKLNDPEDRVSSLASLKTSIHPISNYNMLDIKKQTCTLTSNERCDSMLSSIQSKIQNPINARNHRTCNVENVESNDKNITSRSDTFMVFNRRLYLPKAHELPVKMGSRALTTFRSQQEVMINSLKELHASLKNFPAQDVTVSPPKYLLVQLLQHQLHGLAWLLWRESEIPAGGIMADDMGLGKTLQIISLILKTKEAYSKDFSDLPNVKIGTSGKQKIGGGTLVISPPSVLGHWSCEINRSVKKGALSVYIYHGLSRTRNTHEHTLTNYDVVLSTYGMVQNELDTGPLKSIIWDRVILDEAHVIRNHRSRNAISIFGLKASKKWVLSGTPVHNKSEDCYALIKFLDLKPFSDLAVWRKFVGNNHESGLQRLSVINKAIMLRRTKEQIKSSGQLCSLRRKTVVNIRVELDPDELLLYENVAHISKAILTQYIQEQGREKLDLAYGNTVNLNNNPTTGELEILKNHPNLARLCSNFATIEGVKTHEILVLLLRLRQLCCHPSLICGAPGKRDVQGSCGSEVSDYDHTNRPKRPDLFVGPNEHLPNSNPEIFDESHPLFNVERISSKVRAVLSYLERIVTSREEDKIIVVSQWSSFLGIIEKIVLKNLGLTCMNLNGKIPMRKRQKVVDSFNSSSMRYRILLLSLAAGGVGLNLIGGNHLLFVDLHWNPQLEIQASDRIYRFGQTKEVFIYKFICKQTIEERILKLQQSKLLIADGILNSCTELSHAANKLTIKDLRILFGIGGNINETTAHG